MASRKANTLFTLAPLLLSIAISGCATGWNAAFNRPVFSEPPAEISSCADCHDDQYATWNRTRHADPRDMRDVPTQTGRHCEVCHVVPAGHADSPETIAPVSISQQTKTEQNELCGRCHYDKDIVGWNAIDPGGRHGLFMSVGLDGSKYKKQLSCLDCHEGHGRHADMLVTMRAHICFKCHKEAIATMGIVQPINYLTFGKACFGCHSPHGKDTWKQWVYTAVGTYITVDLACNTCHISQNAAWQWWVK